MARGRPAKAAEAVAERLNAGSVAILHALHYCPMLRVKIDQSRCQQEGRVVPHNRRFCCGEETGKKCTSLWRICVICAQRGTIDHRESIVLPESNFCPLHTNDAEARRERAVVAPQRLTAFGDGDEDDDVNENQAAATGREAATHRPASARPLSGPIVDSKSSEQYRKLRPVANPPAAAPPPRPIAATLTALPEPLKPKQQGARRKPLARPVTLPRIPSPIMGKAALPASMRDNARPEARRAADAQTQPRLLAATSAQAAPAAKPENNLIGDRVLTVPVDRIRPSPGQPRQFFNEGDTKELAECLKELGQLDPLKVRPVEGDPDHDYELVGGERRWRAHKLAGIKLVKAIVVNVADPEQQFEFAAVDNLHRRGYHSLEAARAIKRIMEKRGRSAAEMARIIGWEVKEIYRHLSLSNLHPKVQTLMEPTTPKARRLRYSTALQLVGLPQEKQAAFAEAIVEGGMRLGQAMFFIRQEAARTGVRIGSGRRRKPDDDFRSFRTLLTRTEDGAGTLPAAAEDGIVETRLEEMFKYRGAADLQAASEQVARITAHFQRVLRILKRIASLP